MIANKYKVKKYCEDYTKIENYEEALKSPLRYDLHHRNEISEHKSKKQLITENLYYGRPPEELIFIEAGEHMRLHREGKHLSEETKKKLSDANKGKHRPAFSIEWKQKISESKKGKNLSAETRKRMSKAKKGKPGACLGRHWHTENSHRIWTE